MKIEPAQPGDAEQLAQVINDAYAIGEAGIWAEGNERITPAGVADILGELLRAELDGRVVGGVRVQPVDASTAELGLLSVAPDQWRGGVGHALLRGAEDRARALGATTMELKVLTPTDGPYPRKAELRAWYERRGYRAARSEPFDSDALVRPCEFRVMEKPLS